MNSTPADSSLIIDPGELGLACGDLAALEPKRPHTNRVGSTPQPGAKLEQTLLMNEGKLGSRSERLPDRHWSIPPDVGCRDLRNEANLRAYGGPRQGVAEIGSADENMVSIRPHRYRSATPLVGPDGPRNADAFLGYPTA
jgi:hypothetical protein